MICTIQVNDLYNPSPTWHVEWCVILLRYKVDYSLERTTKTNVYELVGVGVVVFDPPVL